MDVVDKLKTFFKDLRMNDSKENVPLIESEFPLENFENGLVLSGNEIPEEMLIKILSFVNPKQLLQLGLVCKHWYNLTHSFRLWSEIYEKKYKKKSKKLSWYVYYCLFCSRYFDQNLIKNGNGEEDFAHWEITKNGGDGFIVEPQPIGANPLPLNVTEFNEKTSCFATSFSLCRKHQTIKLTSPLFLHIMKTHKPHIYVSEWVTGRFDCGSCYLMTVQLLNQNNEVVEEKHKSFEIRQWGEPRWTKIWTTFTDYPDSVRSIVFEHEGRDTQFWKGHYGTKMAGAVLIFIFDSLKPCEQKEKI